MPPGKPSTLPQTIPSVPIAEPVERRVEARVFRRVGCGRVDRRRRCPGFRRSARSTTFCSASDIRVALAVAVGIQNQRGPALRFLLVVRLVPHLGVEPAHHAAAAAAAGPQRIVGVLGEQQVVRGEAGVDHRGLLGRRIVHRQLAARSRRPA